MPTCAVSQLRMAEKCSGLPCDAEQAQGTARLDCVVQEVIIRLERQAEPALSWLTGHARLLYVEVSAVGMECHAQQTETGILLQDGWGKASGEEVWVFGSAAVLPEDGVRVDRGEALSLCVQKGPVDLALRVFRSYMTWHVALGLRAPLELVAEVQFGLGEQERLELSVPLLREGRECGEASLVLRRQGEQRVQTSTHLPRWADEDSRPFSEANVESQGMWEEAHSLRL